MISVYNWVNFVKGTGMKRMSIDVPDDLMSWYKEAAKEKGISMSAMVKWILAEFRAKND